MRLKELYNEAIKLKASDIIVNKPTVYTAKNPARNNRPTRTLLGNSNDTRLVYISDSPNYCKPDTILGITGTLNRECERNSCTKLCSNCGHRKHSVVRKVVNNKCNCKFHWCCKVTCSTCVEKKLVTKCRPSASNWWKCVRESDVEYLVRYIADKEKKNSCLFKKSLCFMRTARKCLARQIVEMECLELL